MRKMRRRKGRGLVVVVLGLLVAAAGVVYAHWTETLTVEAEVATGNMTMEWTGVFTDDDGTMNVGYDNELFCKGTWVGCPVEYRYPGKPLGDPGLPFVEIGSADPAGPGPIVQYGGFPPRWDKDVADCIGSISVDGRTLMVNAYNTYPLYNCTVWSTHTNTGTVPMKAQVLRHRLYKDGVPVTGFSPDGTWENLQGHWCGQQIDPGESYMTVNWFRLENDADQGATYSVEQEIEFVNWNEWDDTACEVYMHGVYVAPWSTTP